MRKTVEKATEAKSWFFENDNKIDKILAGQRKTEKTQVTTIRNEIGDIIRDPADIKRITREYSAQLTHIWQIRRHGSIPKKHKLPQLTQDKRDNMNSPKTIKEREFLI